MTACKRMPQLCLLALVALAQPVSAAAPPFGPSLAGMARRDVIDAQVTCDGRGCFTFGPQQSYAPPTFRPSYLPPNAPPIYHRPSGVPQPIAPYYRVVPPAPARAAAPPIQPQAVYRQPDGTYTAHDQWCLSRYRSFNPETNRYKSIEGRYKLCHSPHD